MRILCHSHQVMREFPEPGSCEAIAGARARKRSRTSSRYDAWHAEGEEGWNRAPFSPPQLTAAIPAVDTPATIACTRPPDRKRSRTGGGGDGSTPAMVGGDALCATASPPKRHTPPAKERSVIRETEVTPYACGESCEDQGMAAVRAKGGGGPGNEDGRRCLPGGDVGAVGGGGVAVTPLERNPPMPDPESMRKCLDEYMEVRHLACKRFCLFDFPPCSACTALTFKAAGHLFGGCRERY